MIYECPQCRMPQEAGCTVCPRCHAEFDGPVPDDAVVPVRTTPAANAAAPVTEANAQAAEAAAPAANAEALQEAEEPAPGAEEPAVEANPLTQADAQPFLTPPSFQTPPAPPSYVPPPYVSPTPAPPLRPPLGRLARVLLVAFPIVLLLVLGTVYFANSLNTDADNPPVSPPPASSAPGPAPVSSAPAAAPVLLQGGANTAVTEADARTKLLIGRWENKAGDFFVFSSDRTGTQGNVAQPQGDTPFSWGLVQNRLMLYREKNTPLRFNAGPDNNTIFIAAQTGHYVQFTRKVTSESTPNKT